MFLLESAALPGENGFRAPRPGAPSPCSVGVRGQAVKESAWPSPFFGILGKRSCRNFPEQLSAPLMQALGGRTLMAGVALATLCTFWLM